MPARHFSGRGPFNRNSTLWSSWAIKNKKGKVYFSGDIVVVDKNQEPRNGDIGAFMIHDTEATVKYLDTVSGRKYLIPANKEFENIEVNENTQPIGKVVSLFRDI